MKLSLQTADIDVPDQVDPAAAIARTTHLAVSAHQDDLEIMAAGGILACVRQPDLSFTGVVVTDAANSPRDGLDRDYTETREVRRKEQRTAASVGEYSAVLPLDHPSVAVRNPADTRPVEDLVRILRASRPAVVYTHKDGSEHSPQSSLRSPAVRP
jgi:LmbE family N-acetylglucosaminyl deacetylase